MSVWEESSAYLRKNTKIPKKKKKKYINSGKNAGSGKNMGGALEEFADFGKNLGPGRVFRFL